MVFPEGARAGSSATPNTSSEVELPPSAQPTAQVWRGSWKLAAGAAAILVMSLGVWVVFDKLHPAESEPEPESAADLRSFDPSGSHLLKPGSEPLFQARPGSLTLITNPVVDAFAGNQRLGTTPFYGVA